MELPKKPVREYVFIRIHPTLAEVLRRQALANDRTLTKELERTLKEALNG